MNFRLLYQTIIVTLFSTQALCFDFSLHNSSGIRNQSETFYLAAYQPAHRAGEVKNGSSVEHLFSPPIQTLVYDTNGSNTVGISPVIDPSKHNLTGNVLYDMSLKLKLPAGKYIAVDKKKGHLVLTENWNESYGAFSIYADDLFYTTYESWTVCFVANSTEISKIYLSAAIDSCPQGKPVNVVLKTIGLTSDHAIPSYP